LGGGVAGGAGLGSKSFRMPFNSFIISSSLDNKSPNMFFIQDLK
jgi:hypothetical protein